MKIHKTFKNKSCVFDINYAISAIIFIISSSFIPSCEKSAYEAPSLKSARFIF